MGGDGPAAAAADAADVVVTPVDDAVVVVDDDAAAAAAVAARDGTARILDDGRQWTVSEASICAVAGEADAMCGGGGGWSDVTRRRFCTVT